MAFEVFSSDQKTDKISRLPLCYPVSQTLNWCSCATIKIVILVQSWLKENKNWNKFKKFPREKLIWLRFLTKLKMCFLNSL